ncbi:hypothetical protein PROFUN_12486 [Planoprotostelium fungivorum]|uniref:EF-hand domain-containing protein n=1 Tax=Planoprotostelium fungivorum TaxID=1890364 RepID=A0A2P6N784_9EUKA|nr:hypothetical protein PROFUN_12486 [Planoprotostelium fungivorum]
MQSWTQSLVQPWRRQIIEHTQSLIWRFSVMRYTNLYQHTLAARAMQQNRPLKPYVALPSMLELGYRIKQNTLNWWYGPPLPNTSHYHANELLQVVLEQLVPDVVREYEDGVNYAEMMSAVSSMVHPRYMRKVIPIIGRDHMHERIDPRVYFAYISAMSSGAKMDEELDFLFALWNDRGTNTITRQQFTLLVDALDRGGYIFSDRTFFDPRFFVTQAFQVYEFEDDNSITRAECFELMSRTVTGQLSDDMMFLLGKARKANN